MIRAYLLNIEELDNITIDKSLFSKRRLEITENFKREEDKKLSTASELLLIYALKQISADFPLPLKIKEDERGRPELEEKLDIGKDPALKCFKGGTVYFNISHSKDYAACAVSNEPIGIDIEYVKMNKLPNPEKILHPEEAQTLAFITNPSEKSKYFFECWTLKESYLKNLGIGLAIRPNEFRVSEDLLDAPGKKLKKRYVHCCTPGEVRNTDWKFDASYKVSVCSMKKDPDFKITALKASDFE